MSAQLRFTIGCTVITTALLTLAGCGQQLAPNIAQETSTPGAVDSSRPSESSLESPMIRNRRESPGESELKASSDETVAAWQSPSHKLLTAGALDDARNVTEFRQYMATAQQSDRAGNSGLLSHWSGQRIEIMVRNNQGQPVPEAIVQIFKESDSAGSIQLKYQPDIEPAESQVLVAALRTGSDGRTHFLPGIDGDQHGESWTAEISTPDGELRVRQEALSAPKASWDLVIGSFPSQMPQQLDLALVIDTTGSMGDELEYLKLEISNIASRIEQLFPGISQRFALILYRDNGDRYVTRNFDFTDSLSDFQQTLSAQHAGGGGDYPEAMHAALEQSADLSWRSRNTARVMFLVGDAPPHHHQLSRTFDAVQKLRQRDVVIFPVAGSGTRDAAEFTLRTAAFLTSGQYLFLTDHSGIGLPHAAPHAETYNVEWLSSVMLRMIVSELSGREILPSEILATDKTGGRLLAQSVPEDPHPYAQRPARPSRRPVQSAATWFEIRPLMALTLLLILVMAERFLTRRPFVDSRRSSMAQARDRE